MLISHSRWICVVMVSVFALSGCALLKKLGPAEDGIDVEADLPDCPEGLGVSDGDAPKLLVKLGQIQIMVCGSEAVFGTDAQVEPGAELKIVAEDPVKSKSLAAPVTRVALSEFNVYSVGEGGRLSPSMREIAGVNNFEIYQDGLILVFDEMLFFNGSWTPAFRSGLECKEDECEFLPEKCVLEVKRVGQSKDLDEIRGYVLGKNRGQTPDVRLIERVADLAYSGDKSAQKFFLQPPNQLKLEGPAGEVFSGVAGMISALQAAKCIN